jgi:Protein of unknown function (DUF2892)
MKVTKHRSRSPVLSRQTRVYHGRVMSDGDELGAPDSRKVERSIMSMTCNLGRTDRVLRVFLGAALGVAGVLVHGHPLLGRLMGVAGALIILSAFWGT